MSESFPEVRRQPLMQVVAKLNRALGELNADLRAGGFRQNCRGLARELYASFTATIAATRGTEAEARAWAIGHALAIDLYRSGTPRGALVLLEGLVELAADQCPPEILARLTNAAEAIDQRVGRRRRARARTAVAATALVGIALYLLVTHDGNLIRQSLSTLTSAATSPSDIALANVSTSSAPTATVPKAIGSSDKVTTGAAALVTAGRTAADATEKSPPQGPGQFLVPDEVRYAKARKDQLKAQATSATRTPKADTPLLDLKTHDGAAAVQAELRTLGYYHHTVDGKWGPMSVAALSSFRREKGLSSGGVWDLAAQSALLGK
jgi:hypothetical protein